MHLHLLIATNHSSIFSEEKTSNEKPANYG